jgi:hypothetical protein
VLGLHIGFGLPTIASHSFCCRDYDFARVLLNPEFVKYVAEGGELRIRDAVSDAKASFVFNPKGGRLVQAGWSKKCDLW